MTATVFTEALHPCAFLVNEGPGFESRDTVTVAANQTIVAGQLLGKIGTPASEATTVAYPASNTGNGALTVSAIGASAIDGVYTVELDTAGATGVFDVVDPTGAIVGAGKVGTAFAGPISFTLAAGGTAWAVGDLIQITVARPLSADVYEAWSPAATDGSQVAVAIAAYPITTGSATGKITAITRRAEVRLSDLTFASGATQTQINEAMVALNKQGIVAR